MAQRVAIINDDPVFLDLMRDVLSEAGYEPYPTAAGDLAYRQVRDLQPDAIILDFRIESPDVGYKTLELLKLDRALSATPLIVCSAHERELRDRRAYLESKGCLLLPKPFILADLLQTLAQALEGIT